MFIRPLHIHLHEKKRAQFLGFSPVLVHDLKLVKREENINELLRSGVDIYINILSAVVQFALKNIPEGREEVSPKLRWVPQLMIETAILIFFNLYPKASFASYNFNSILKEVLMRKFLLEAFFFTVESMGNHRSFRVMETHAAEKNSCS